VSGRYHTLYKHQLGLKRQRFRPESVSLEKAFSMSINPFFGKLGIDYLKEEEFADVAEDFLFNVPIEFDLPLCQSYVFKPDTTFERAELTSGFNTRTTISPLHAALIAALPVTGGKIMRPFLVERIVSDGGEDIYCSDTESLSQPLSSRSVKDLSRLMQGTIRYGTARKSFSRLRRLRKSKGWFLGGKTGAINLAKQQQRCEWFAGFAEKGEERLAISMVLVHGEIRTVKPSLVVAELIKSCIKNQSVRTAALEKKKKDVSVRYF
jgi:peptidoglycan glycosyltransferase